MIQRRVVVNLVVFFGLTGLLIVYGFFTLVHNPLSRPLTVYSYIDDTGGVRSGFTVAMRGIPIGHVRGLTLANAPDPPRQPTRRKVRIALAIDGGVSVPSDAEVQVERANPLGEQEVDLITRTGSTAPPARNGAVLAPTSTPTPPDVGQVVAAADQLFSAVPTADLETVVHELAVAFDGRAQDVRDIVDESIVLSHNTLAYQDAFRRLLAAAPPVLDTVASVGPQLHDALVNTETLLDLLNQRKGDIVNLFHTSTAFADAANQFIADNTPNLACLTKDLGDLGANVGSNPNYANLDATLKLNQFFFGPINAITPVGPAKSITNVQGQPLPGSPARNNQTWFRVRQLLPPQQPSADAYAHPHEIPDTYPGAACLSVFGRGVPAGHQANPAPPVENGKVIPPPAPTRPVEQLPPPTPAGGGTGPGNVLTGPGSGVTPASTPARPATSGHPETSLYVGAGLVGLGTMERRELRKLRRSLKARRKRR